jgi:hypothetical protein
MTTGCVNENAVRSTLAPSWYWPAVVVGARRRPVLGRRHVGDAQTAAALRGRLLYYPHARLPSPASHKSSTRFHTHSRRPTALRRATNPHPQPTPSPPSVRYPFSRRL